MAGALLRLRRRSRRTSSSGESSSDKLRPLWGTCTIVLVALAAMSPVSNDSSFATMRCVSPLLFCHATIRPPADAGFGANDCEPLSPKIEIVVTLLVGVGVGLPLEPSPQAVNARATAKPCPDGAHSYLLRVGHRTVPGRNHTSCKSPLTREFAANQGQAITGHVIVRAMSKRCGTGDVLLAVEI